MKTANLTKSEITVFIVDDQALIRQGLANLLDFSNEINVIAQASDGLECIQQLDSGLKPDIILLDIRMPKATGIDVLAHIQQQKYDIPALILTTFDDHDILMNGIQAGARGYLLKDIELEALVSAIKRVLAGELMIQPALTQKLLQNLSSHQIKTKGKPHADRLVEPLTTKEIEILKLIASGLSNKEIAQSLFNAEGTIRNQVSVILAKLNVRDRTRAVLKSIELGLLKA